jgi:hypothetical protein
VRSYSSVVSISTFSIKNANQFFYEINVKKNYFPMLYKFVMHRCINVEMIVTQFLDVNWGRGVKSGFGIEDLSCKTMIIINLN